MCKPCLHLICAFRCYDPIPSSCMSPVTSTTTTAAAVLLQTVVSTANVMGDVVSTVADGAVGLGKVRGELSLLS